MALSKQNKSCCPLSYLSPRVRNLFLIDLKASDACNRCFAESFIISNLSILDVPKIGQMLSPFIMNNFNYSNESEQLWESVTVTLSSVIQSVKSQYVQEGKPFLLYDIYTGWLGPKLQRDFIQAYTLCRRNDNITCILFVTSMLDRALGDLLFTVTKSSKCIPLLMKDLLQSNILRSLLGEDLVFILRILMGTPKAINIRNLVWHGFVNSDEANDGYCVFIYYLVRTIGHVLLKDCFVPEHRALSKADDWYMDVNMSELDNVAAIKEVFCTSSFIPIGQNLQWDNLAEYFAAQEAGAFLVNSIILLEHALRVKYVSHNRLPQNTVLTADSETYYIILDDILGKTTNGTDNVLPAKLGRNSMELLMDLFNYHCTIRLRDRISHGEIDLETASMQLCSVVLAVLLFLCRAYPKNTADSPDCDYIRDKIAFVSSYQSRYHPLVKLKKIIVDVAQQRLEVAKTREHIVHQLQINEDSQLDDGGFLDISALSASFTEITQCLLESPNKRYIPYIFRTVEESFPVSRAGDYLNSFTVSVLYRSAATYRIIHGLGKTAETILTNYFQLQLYLEKSHESFIMRQLSSRHRTQFIKVVKDIFPIYDQLLCTIMMMVESQYYLIMSEEPDINVISKHGSYFWKYIGALITIAQRTRKVGNSPICGNIKELSAYWKAFTNTIKGQIPTMEHISSESR